MGPLIPNRIASLQPPSGSLIDGREVEVVVINFASPFRFVAGDILGLRQYYGLQNEHWQHNTSSTSTGTTFLPLSDYSSIKVLRQSGGYGLALICDEWQTWCNEYPTEMRKLQEMPYIVIETSKLSLKACNVILYM
jgi:hypothetical protein